eukprot:2059117-Rhodomonas_salina.3
MIRHASTGQRVARCTIAGPRIDTLRQCRTCKPARHERVRVCYKHARHERVRVCYPQELIHQKRLVAPYSTSVPDIAQHASSTIARYAMPVTAHSIR